MHNMFCRSIAICLLAAAAAAAQNDVIYDSAADPRTPKSDLHVQLHQRVEEEAQAPLNELLVELMTQPCMGWYIQAACALYNPEANRELFALTSASDVDGAVLLFVAPPENACQTVQLPGTAGAWALAPMKHDRLAAGTYYDGAIHVFDMPSWTVVKVIDIPGEAYVWNLVEGGDGRLYGGTFPGGKLIALDQDALEIEDCGPAAPPNRFLHRVSRLPDGRLLCSAGNEAPTIRIYDPATKQFSDPPASWTDVRDGVRWGDYFISGNRVFDRQLVPLASPPFPTPDAERGLWSAEPALSDKRVLYIRQGHALYRCEEGAAAPTLVCDIDLRGGRWAAPTIQGGAFGVRGQQFFFVAPGDASLTRHGYATASPPRAPIFLSVDAHKRVWGGPASGHTLFLMDGDTGVFVSLGAIAPSAGRVQDLAFHDDIAYGVSGPRGELFSLDVDTPWDEWNGKNPRILASLADKGCGRPTGGMEISAQGQLVSGWSAAAGGGGAVAVTDRDTGRTRLAKNPLGSQGVSGLALDEQYIYIGTTVNGDNPSADGGSAPQFGLLGKDTLQPYWNHAFAGATTVDRLCLHPAMNRVVMAVDQSLRVFRIDETALQPIPDPPPPPATSAAIVQRGDAYVYYGHEDALVRMHLDSGQWETMTTLPDTVSAVAAVEHGEIYLACGVSVFRVKLPDATQSGNE